MNGGQGSPAFWRIGTTMASTVILGIAAVWSFATLFAQIPSSPSSSSSNNPARILSGEIPPFTPSENIRAENASPEITPGQTAEVHPLRLNISWTTAEPAIWNGEIRIDGGFFWNSVPLGSDSAASVTFRRSGENAGVIPLATPDPVAFCGIQTTVVAPPTAILTVTLAMSGAAEPLRRRVSISELFQAPVQVPFDVQDNGLLIERAAGDEIPLTILSRKTEARNGGGSGRNETVSSMVFSEGETLDVGIFTKFLPDAVQRQLHLTLKSTENQNIVWNESIELTDETVRRQPRLDISVPLQGLVGPFDLAIELVPAAVARSRFSIIPKEKTKETVLARRVIQGVVVSNEKETPRKKASDEATPFDLRDQLLETVDPTNPSWWKIFARNPLFAAQPAAETAVNSPEAVRGQQASGRGTAGVDLLRLWKWGGLQTRMKTLSGEFTWGQWDNFWQHPLGSGHLHPLDKDDPQKDSFVRLESSGNPADPSWEAYTIPIRELGKPHVLEIEYPADLPQKLGVSILEPTASGGLFPGSLDNGLIVPDDRLGDRIPGRVLRWEILFWPKTKTPMILVLNHDDKKPAVFGRIRVYRAKEDIPTLSKVTDGGRGGRSFAAIMSRPTLCDQFSAESRPSSVGVFGARDWRTFYQASQRLTDYLKISGYDSLLLSVMADGSALYPSNILKPNPKFDSGVFLPSGEDPVRKDVPELLFRLFDREQITLVPLLDFNAPIPSLEEGRGIAAETSDGSRNGAEGGTTGIFGDEIFWIGPDGTPVTRQRQGMGGSFTPYNLLHPAVQTAMKQVVGELVERYASHPSFDGLALELTDESSALLPPDPLTGLDDQTVRRFADEVGLVEHCPGNLRDALGDFLGAADAGRFARRAEFLQNNCLRAWIEWRCQTVARFYGELAALITARRPDARLRLAPTAVAGRLYNDEIFSSDIEEARQLDERLRTAGLDPAILSEVPGVLLLRPGTVAAIAPEAVQERIAVRETDETIRLFTRDKIAPGALFYHETTPKNIPSFDAVSPFRPTMTQIATRAVGSDAESRKRFARQLAAADTLEFFDGGRMIPMGQEEPLREMIAVFRSLPARGFSTLSEGEYGDLVLDAQQSDGRRSGRVKRSLQPVVYRYLKTGDDYWAYLINDAPFHCGVTLAMSYRPEAKPEFITGGRAVSKPDENHGNFRWSFSLRPYDIIAWRIDDPESKLTRLEVNPPEEIGGDGGRLALAVRDALDRTRLAEGGIPFPLKNADFEESSAVTPPIPTEGISGTDATGSDTKKSKLLGLDIPKVNLLKNPFGPGANREDVSESPNRSSQNASPADFAGEIPGWRRFGDDGFIAVRDTTRRAEGRASLRLENGAAAGGVVSLPMESIKTGRLFTQVTLGIPQDATSLPLRVTLEGTRLDGGEIRRSIDVGPAFYARAREAVGSGQTVPEDGVVWIRDLLLFDNLPMTGLENATLRMELLAPSVVWVDDLRLYKMALLQSEQRRFAEELPLLRTAMAADRTADLLAFLETPGQKLLAREISDKWLVTHRPASNDEIEKGDVERQVAESAEGNRGETGRSDSGKPVEVAARPTENAPGVSGEASAPIPPAPKEKPKKKAKDFIKNLWPW